MLLVTYFAVAARQVINMMIHEEDSLFILVASFPTITVVYDYTVLLVELPDYPGLAISALVGFSERIREQIMAGGFRVGHFQNCLLLLFFFFLTL